MIIQITGKVKFPITLDPSVWIFDDRKILIEDMFAEKNQQKVEKSEDDAAKRWKEEIYEFKINPPVNPNITRKEKEEILKNSYVMPLKDFISHAEIEKGATQAVLETTNGNITIPLEQLVNSYLYFAEKGKPLKKNGPVHMYFKDGSNQQNPIKGIHKITIV